MNIIRNSNLNKEFLTLSLDEKHKQLSIVNNQLNINPFNAEKDFWICWVLEKLFEFTDQMVFKGGTSLSKVYEVIDRYSEDIDITIDYTQFIECIDLINTSKTKLRQISDKLKEYLIHYLQNEVLPFLNGVYQNEFPHESGYFVIENNDVINFVYPSILSQSSYVLNWIKIEFGIRNATTPSEQKEIHTYFDKVFGNTSNISVNVLSLIRTFWEKATLIHVECHRDRLSDSPDRLSRHWYDLYKLYHSNFGAKALAEIDIFNDVLLVKKAFYNASYANYDDCNIGKFKLIPASRGLHGLQLDYQKMIDSGFFFQTPPSFEQIIDSLSELEKKINASLCSIMFL